MLIGIPAREKTVSTPLMVRNLRTLAYVFQSLRAVTLMLFTPFPLGVSMGPLKRIPSFSIVSLASGVIPVLNPLSNTARLISTNSYFRGTPAALKIFRTASMISGPIPSPGATAIVVIIIRIQESEYRIQNTEYRIYIRYLDQLIFIICCFLSI